MPYQVADGYNNAGGLATLSLQPKSEPMQPGIIRTNGEGVVIEDGKPTQTWRFSFITYSDYETVMTELGLLTARSGKKTIRSRQNSDGEFANYNAILTRRDGSRSMVGGYSDVYVDITGIAAL